MGLVGDVVAHVDIALHLFTQVADGGLKLAVVLLGLDILQCCHKEFQVGGCMELFLNLQPALCLYDGGDVAIGQRQHLHHLSIDTRLIQVGLYGYLHLGVALCYHTDRHMVLLGLLDEHLARLAAYQNG